MNELTSMEKNLLRAELIVVTARNVRVAGRAHTGKDLQTFLLKDCEKLQAICDKLGISVDLFDEAAELNERKYSQ